MTRDPADAAPDARDAGASDGQPDAAVMDSGSSDALPVVSSTCSPVAAQGPINLVRAQATGACSRDTAACSTVTYHLGVWIDLADLAYTKAVTLVYRAHPSAPWSEAPAHYFGPSAPGRETWYAETPAIDISLPDGAAFEFSLRYDVSGGTYGDDNGGASYAVSVQGPGARSVLLGLAPITLSSAFLDASGALVGTAMIRGAASGGGAFDVVYTVDDWTHVLTASGTFQAPLAGCDAGLWTFRVPIAAPFDKVSFALRYTAGEEVVWDSHFGRNYARYTSLAGFGGRWDVTVKSPVRTFPSWFELTSDHGELVGGLVGRVGSLRPIRDIDITAGKLGLALPPQYETQSGDLTFEATLANATLSGSCSSDDGSATFAAVSAPALTSSSPPSWGPAVALSTGPGLAGWSARDPSAPNGWQMQNGTLVNSSPGTDLVSAVVATDFQLHFEFNLPPSGNSGVFLRGRYEVQLTDDFGLPVSTLRVGAIYGFLVPTTNAGLPAGQWQSCDVTLVGRQVTVVLNGVTIIDAEEIPGITGGALDSAEGTPGPILLQGDHTDVSFRNITLRVPQ